ncbi:hypothetical protein E2562_038345 [Oryza meyeriana var. granulata]|uniref:Leucine-rich repeat-containing N-terminal plant-type domain-containing protein n=1 Tax=Oryza meyeriana var. granulata TaxID=110450 RepID=A0A6G1FGE0_9ORYZ|nr:hypothetical protein E2562_038345 [Oryza meyeriana var. granulata]
MAQDELRRKVLPSTTLSPPCPTYAATQESGGEEEVREEESNLPIAIRNGTRSKAFVAYLDSVATPSDWREAKQDPRWRQAMLDELEALEKNKTWDLVPFPEGKKDRSSLLKFLRELSQDGGLAASWLDCTDCCKWDGITCRQDKTVIDVSLASRSLQGHISPSLGNLAGLLRLNLSHNLLSGALPIELVSSSSIIIIGISFNHLNGGLNELPSSTLARPLQTTESKSSTYL